VNQQNNSSESVAVSQETGQIDDFTEELELIRLCKEGDRRAFGDLVRRYYGLIVNICYRILQDSSMAADAAQDSFVKAYESIKSFEHKGIPFKNWLCRIAANVSKNMYRRNKLEAKIFQNQDYDFLETSSPFEAEADQILERREQIEMVNKALKKVKLSNRIAFILFEITELSVKDIAVILHLPEFSVRRRIVKAREQILSNIRQDLVYDEKSAV
jgi:RNA polymerase sigma-70 factor (ECF subfamily)